MGQIENTEVPENEIRKPKYGNRCTEVSGKIAYRCVSLLIMTFVRVI